MNDETKSQEDLFFSIAEEVAIQASCPRRSVGCILVDSYDTIVSNGYNGSARDVETCLEVGCLIEGGHCVRAVHAEIRAIANAARRGVNLHDCRAYCTLLPCINCMQALRIAGVRVIIYDEVYDREEKNHLFRMAERAGISLIERIR